MTVSSSPVRRPALSGACLYTLFESVKDRAPDAVAIESETRSVTYGQLADEAETLAGALRAQGAGPESTVGVCLPSGPELVATVLAVLRTGAAYVPMDPGLPEKRRRLIVQNTGALGVVRPESPPSAVPDGSIVADPPTVGPDNAAYISHTSGTTSRPKGVVVPHRGVINRVVDTIRRHGITADDRVLLRTPVGFDACAWEIFVPLLGGATVVVGSGDTAGDPEAVARTVLERGVTVLQVVPSMLRLVGETLGTRHTRLRLVYSAGDQLDEATARDARTALGPIELWNVYGPTECSIGCVEGRYEADGTGVVPIGEPIDEITTRVLDAQGEPVPAGVPGELYVGGPGVARGYLGMPGLTAERFVPDPYGTAGARLYRTGDRVRVLADGRLEFLGRIDHQLNIRGVRIEPDEVERALREHPGVRHAVSAASRDRLIGYVVGADDVTAGGLREHLRSRVPAEYVPSHFEFLDEFPLNDNGKVDRTALPEPRWDDEHVAPRDAAETFVSRIWEDLLGVSGVGAKDDFFQRGGYSLLVPRLAARLRESGHPIPVAELYAASTVEAQARLVNEEHDGAGLVRTEQRGGRPPSPGQRRLWFLQQLDPDNTEYLVPLVIRLPGRPHPGRLRESLGDLARRHEILRTRYVAEEGELRQVVDQQPHIELDVPGHELAQVLRTEITRGIDLGRGPVWRATLTSDDRLVVLIHHIACDGLSAAILERDLLEFEAGRAENRRPRLPELPVQYADYAVWQNRRLDDGELDGELEYWKHRLAGITTLTLPMDRPRGQQRDSEGAVYRFDVDAPLSAAVRQLGRERGATPFMTFLAAYCCVLARLCGTDDVTLGTPVAGRLRPEVHELVGFFVNTLVLRCDMTDVREFADAVSRARETALEAFAHQELPFERLVEELQPERDLSKTPLFQVMFELVDQRSPGAQDSSEAVLEHWDTAKFDLTLHLENRAGGSLKGSFEYATDVFDRETVARMARAFVRVLDGAATGTPLTELDLMDPAERHRVVVELNDTATEVTDRCIHELIEEQAHRTPDAVAVEYEGSRLTYAEVDARANALALRLRKLGVGPDIPVGVLLDRSPALVIGMLGVLKAGGCFVPLETDFPVARVRQLLNDVGARTCLADVGTPVPEGVTAVTVGDDEAAAGPPSQVMADHLAAVYYTSGSTGKPKGVAATHRGWVNRLVAMQDALALQPGEAVLQKTTVVFDDTPVECFWPLMVGGRVAVLAPGAHRDPVAILDATAQHDVSVVLFVPSMLSLVVDALTPDRRRGLRVLREIGTSGEALSAELVRSYRDRVGPEGPALHNHWGVTEASIDSTRHTVGAADAAGSGTVTIGRPLANNRIYVLDGHMRPVPPGTVGEIYVGGLGLARGYHDDPARTALAFVPDPFGSSGRLYRTGDHARLRADGSIDFLGRADHQFKVRGVRVELGEIEETLRSHAGVRDATLHVWQAPSGDKRIVGYVVLRDGASVNELWRHLEDRLPGYMVPSVLSPLSEIPRTPSGKVDRQALTAPDMPTLVREQGFVAPRTAAEQVLTGIWSEVLGTEVGVHNDFFRAGGHSLLVARVVSRIQEEFGVELPIREIFDRSTVAELVPVIEERIRAEIEGLPDEEIRRAATRREDVQ
ncbi:non-ribosomal peptide synthetase [Saccharomonospora halophila]|uniref:non-ribosomal peptide synthetase n=1 Tax=Saccharomonospora halophila TaxID=129922 RepID=UPI0003A189BF|nr:non-ribosomal peptide synthetase [Saccharomonospora halophila]